jgi:dipeptidyl aminopeptidase/acylaminoacyl peptidase
MKSVLFLFLMTYSSLVSAAVLAPNANLIVDGLPHISTDIVAQVQKYTDFRPTVFLDLHPTKSQMLVKTRPEQSQVMQLHRIDDANGKAICLTTFPDDVAYALYEPIEGLYCVFNKDINGNEKYQNYRYDFDTGRITLLTDGKSRNRLGVWSPKGDKMAFTSNERNGKDQDVYIMDPLHPESKRLVLEFSNGDSWSVESWSPDGATLLLSEYLSINNSNLWTLDLAEGRLTLLTPKNQRDQIAYSQPRYSLDGNSIFFITDKDYEFKTLANLDIKTGQLKYLTKSINWDIDSYKISPDGKQIVCVSNEDGISRGHLLTLSEDGNNLRLLKDIPLGVITKITWEKNSDGLRFNLSGAKIVDDIYCLKLGNGHLKRLTKSKATMETDQFVEPELITWESFDGKRMSGFLYRPSHTNRGRCPVRVIIHGGPESQFRPGFLGRINYFTDELGVALLFPNIRGSSGYGKTFLQLPNGLQRVDAYEDLNALLDWIKMQPDLDGDRIMVSGGSYGGHATLAVATRYNDKIACSLSIVGMSNLVTYLENTEIYRRDLRRAIYGDERIPAVRDFLASIAPMNHAKAITKPIFVVQGLMDPRVPYSESEQIVKTLKNINTPVWFLTAKNEGHGFSKKENVDFLFYATVEFVNRHLLRPTQ